MKFGGGKYWCDCYLKVLLNLSPIMPRVLIFIIQRFSYCIYITSGSRVDIDPKSWTKTFGVHHVKQTQAF
jgi:hypothetical protein